VGEVSVEIRIDQEKCNFSMYDPTGCKKCLLLCPACVFASRPRDKRDFSRPREERVDPTIWVLLTPWADYCNGCTGCVRSCPKKAISIEIDGRLVG